MSDTKEELKSLVRSIAEDIEAAVEGRLYKLSNGDTKVIDDMEEWKKSEYDKLVREFKEKHPEDKFDADEMGYDTYQEWMEDEIGTAEDVEEPEEMSLYDYISDQGLGDERFEVDSDKELDGGKTLFCYGGPTVWVHDDRVCGYWGCDEEVCYLASDARDAMMDYFQEQWSYVIDK